MNPILATLIQMFLKVVGEWIIIFITNLRASRMDDPSFAGVVLQIIKGIEADHPAWDNAEKWRYAKDAIIQHGKNLGKDLKDSLVNTMIELAVQKMKAGA